MRYIVRRYRRIFGPPPGEAVRLALLIPDRFLCEPDWGFDTIEFKWPIRKLDTTYHDRRLAKRLKDPEFRAAFETRWT